VVVIAEPVLTGNSDVARLFAERLGDQESLTVPELSLAELRQLTVHQPGGTAADGFPGCRIATLAETLDLITLLEKEQQRSIGIVVELRKLWLHRAADLDLGGAVVKLLMAKRPDPGGTAPRTHIAAHDADELRRLHDQYLTREAPHIGIMQLIDDNDSGQAMRLERGTWLPYNYDWLFTNSGLRSISDHVDAIGLAPALLADDRQAALLDFIGDTRLLGIPLIVSPADPLLASGQSSPDEMKARLDRLLTDGTFAGLTTGNYDTVARLLDLQPPQPSQREQSANPIEQIIENLELNKAGAARSAEPLLFH
jgi:glycerophosphoryl diester phosphodiesterase